MVFPTSIEGGPEDAPAQSPPVASILVIVGPGYSHVGEGWRVGDLRNPLSQLLQGCDAAVAERSQLTILAPSHMVACLVGGLQQLTPKALTRLSAPEARAATLDNLVRGRDDSSRSVDFSAATHVLLLEAEAVEPVALAAAAPRTPVAACRGGRFYLSEGGEGREEDVARGLVDYTLPHPRIFGPEAEERLLRLLAHLFACGPRADGSWEFTVNQEGHTPDQFIRLRPASAFLWPGEEITFIDVQARARMQGEAALGYVPAASSAIVWPFLEKGTGSALLTRKRTWLDGDRVIVIGYSS